VGKKGSAADASTANSLKHKGGRQCLQLLEAGCVCHPRFHGNACWKARLPHSLQPLSTGTSSLQPLRTASSVTLLDMG